MLSTSQEGRGYPAGTMGARFRAWGVPAGDEGAPIGLPEAVEGVAVVCCCSSVGLVSVAAALLLMCWRGGRHGSRAKEEQGKERKEKKKRTARKRNKKKGSGACWSVCEYYTLYIIGKTKYFNIKTKKTLFLFGSIKITLYLCGRNTIKRINNLIKIQDYEEGNNNLFCRW